MKTPKKETRSQRIERYMKLSKRDLVIMLVDTQFSMHQIFEAINKGGTKTITITK